MDYDEGRHYEGIYGLRAYGKGDEMPLFIFFTLIPKYENHLGINESNPIQHIAENNVLQNKVIDEFQVVFLGTRIC